jgi:hypothetical protein
MNSGDEVRAFANVYLVFFAPLNPLMVLVFFSHSLTISMALSTCFTAYRDCTGILIVRVLSVRSLAGSGNFREAGISQLLDQISNFLRQRTNPLL